MFRPGYPRHHRFSAGPAGALTLAGVGVSSPRPRRPGGGANGAREFRELLLRQDARELRRARWLADAAAVEHGLDADEQFRFTFAVNEAVANAIEHGAPSPEGHILVRCSSDGRELSFEVHDWGTFAPAVAPTEAMQDRGRGLALMATMVDEVDVSPGAESTVVRLVIRSGRRAAAA